jgi:hypothetical protein
MEVTPYTYSELRAEFEAALRVLGYSEEDMPAVQAWLEHMYGDRRLDEQVARMRASNPSRARYEPNRIK